jgi:hypothetical protein
MSFRLSGSGDGASSGLISPGKAAPVIERDPNLRPRCFVGARDSVRESRNGAILVS